MQLFKKLTSTIAVALAFSLAHDFANGHGGVVLDEDICLVKVGFYEAHFTVFQPTSNQHTQFCEDLPDIGESIFVLEYLHDGLENLDVDFRIIRNITGNGEFANEEDINRIGDLSQITEFYQAAVREPDVFAVIHKFEKAGEFIGIITANNPGTAKTYTAVFPFQAGFTKSDMRDIAVLFTVLGIFFGWLGYTGFKRFKAPSPRFSLVLFIFIQALALQPTEGTASESLELSAANENYQIKATSSIQPITINKIHSWTISLSSNSGKKITGITMKIAGGMPLHDHGMQTEPRVTKELSYGLYQIDGMKFHMRGYWEVKFLIEKGEATDSLILGLNL